ncbi:hypothetical protein N7527_005393 [Penicillium freii]|nr:hypothetical protein N7527_005393 [Penicillium freii]
MDSNVTRDYKIHQSKDSIAYLHIPFAGSGSRSSINKQYDRPGVKLAFQHKATGIDPSFF